MKCLVAIKRVVDPYVAIRIKPDHSAVETSNLKMAMNPFDEIAMEAALQLKEQQIISEILAVSIGDANCQETLRQALARGADTALLIQTEINYEPLAIAKILKWIIDEQSQDLVILGKQAIDNDCNQTGQMLAALLGWPQGTFVSNIDIDPSTSKVTVVREVDTGLETLTLQLPAVLTTDLRLNEPRYISLPNVMKAKSKPLVIQDISDLPLTLNNQIQTLSVTPPATRTTGTQVTSASELVDKLRNLAKVI